jgi:hypothetical protein
MAKSRNRPPIRTNACISRPTWLYLHLFPGPKFDESSNNIDHEHKGEKDNSDKYGELRPEQREHEPG